MKIVAFMQNQWFRNPDKARKIFEHHPDKREELIARFLFASRGLSGRRLRAAFGDLCDQIVWEESSANFGGVSSSLYPADMQHIKRVLEKHQPDIVLGFGRIAGDALESLGPVKWKYIRCDHPAARASDIPAQLLRATNQLESLIIEAAHATVK